MRFLDFQRHLERLAPCALAAWNAELRYLSQRLCFDFLVFDDLSNRDRSFLE